EALEQKIFGFDESGEPESCAVARHSFPLLSAGALWKMCCDPLRYDGFGSSSCFPELQGWHSRLCCSGLQEPANIIPGLWASLLDGTLQPQQQPSRWVNATRLLFVTYHKSGTTLSLALQSSVHLRRWVLGREGLADAGDGDWLRTLWTRTSPGFQRGMHQYQTRRGRLILMISPNEMVEPEIHDLILEGHAKLVHVVRKPTELL
ncbi:unnamed protein product, partial [Symbiodinium necroappetens]